MTKDTPPKITVEWEPITEGVQLSLMESLSAGRVFNLNLMDVSELARDMEEARMLARGYELVEDTAISIEDKWIIKVMGNDFRVASTLIEARSKYDGVWVCLQDNEGREIVLPSEELVTAYRPIE